MTTNSISTKVGTALLRIIAGIVGAGIIACVTYATVTAVGGIWAPTAPLLISLACGLVVGSMCVGLALRSDRKVLATALALTLLCGEGYVLLNIGERELEAREAKQAPVRAAMVERERLQKAVTTTPRLEAALAAQETVRARSAARIAEASCVKLCHDLLTKQQAAADREVEIARAEATEKATAANTALAAIPALAAVSPLAARINVPDWVLDLIRAGLFSVSANGLGAFLLAFSSHSGRRESVSVSHGVPAKSLTFEQPLTDEEIEELRRILTGQTKPLTNDELAAMAGVTKSEMSKRVQKAVEAGKVVKLRAGRFNQISLVA